MTEVRRHNHVNQLTRYGTTAVEYDHGSNSGEDAHQGNGNVVNDGTRKYTYHALNWVKTVSKTDDTLLATYTYDALGRWVPGTPPATLDSRAPVWDGGVMGRPGRVATPGHPPPGRS